MCPQRIKTAVTPTIELDPVNHLPAEQGEDTPESVSLFIITPL